MVRLGLLSVTTTTYLACRVRSWSRMLKMEHESPSTVNTASNFSSTTPVGIDARISLSRGSVSMKSNIRDLTPLVSEIILVTARPQSSKKSRVSTLLKSKSASLM